LKGIPYHLRPSTPEELETHRRLIAKLEAIRREAILCGRIKGAPGATKPDAVDAATEAAA
jgi:hypothetical protein